MASLKVDCILTCVLLNSVHDKQTNYTCAYMNPDCLGLKQNPVFRATRPYLSEPADPRPFFTKIPGFFFVGVFIIEVSILKKKQLTLPKVFKTVARNTRFIVFGLRYQHCSIFDGTQHVRIDLVSLSLSHRKNEMNSIWNMQPRVINTGWREFFFCNQPYINRYYLD